MWKDNISSLARIFHHLRAYKALFWSQGSFVHSTGWLESLICGYPRTKGGYTIPWMNYAVTHLLKTRLTPDLKLFEYGSGYSTLFYARRVQAVTSIEYDPQWFNLLKQKIPANVDLRFHEYIPEGEYSKVILSMPQKYDVLVVDGRDRVRCIHYGLTHLSDTGVVILDDSQRPRYREAIEELKDKHFKLLDIIGVKPGTASTCQTTIAYRDQNCLGL